MQFSIRLCATNVSKLCIVRKLYEQEVTEGAEKSEADSEVAEQLTALRSNPLLYRSAVLLLSAISASSCSIFISGRRPWWANSLIVPLAVWAWVYAGYLASGVGANEHAWIDARQIGPFTIHATFPLAEYDQLFLELPELQRELSRILGLPPARKPIGIFLFASIEQYQSFLRQQFPKVPYRPALFVLDGGLPGVYTFRKPDLDVDLRHECTHALLHAVLPVVPLWLDEGLAKYFEVPASERATGHPYFDDLKWKWSLRLGMVRTIETLEQRNDLAELDATDYRYSWAWVHFMLHGPQRAHQTLVSYLACYHQMMPAGNLSVRLAEAVPNPTDQMIRHFKHWNR
jgi:hypothetical protein